MNIDDWEYFYKINPDTDKLIESNLIYTPLVSPDNKIFCMWFDHTNPYQHEMIADWLPNRPFYTEKMVKFFFDREVKYLNIFKNRSWAPTVLEIDYKNSRIFFEWSGETCNHILYTGRDLIQYCPDWKEQMSAILKDIVNSGYYKTSLYPHCYFVQDGILKTFDFYGCVERKYPYIDLDDIRGMIGETSGHRFVEATEGGLLNIEILFKRALEQYVEWPDNYLSKVYQEIF